MTGVTTLALHQAADEAARDGDFWMALRCSADILEVSPSDHRARTKLALSLVALDRPTEAIRALVVGARDLVRRGFVLSALGMARDALAFQPEDPEVWACLEEAYRRSLPGDRLRVPPPVPPAVEVKAQPFLQIADREELLRRAIECGETAPPSGPENEGPFPLPLFGDMTWSAFRVAMSEIEHRKLPEGAEVVRQGERGDALFVVIRGEVEVLRDGHTLAVLGAGSFFGELSLFLDKPRSASVVTRQATELFVLTRAQVESVAAEDADLSEGLATFARRRLLANVLATSPIFSPFPADEKRRFLSSFETRLVPAGQTVIHESGGSPGLFVIVEGQVQVTKADEQEDPVVVAHLGPGDVFGEIALIRDGVATATVTTTESCMLLQLPRARFADLVAERPEAKRYLDGLSEARVAELKSAFGTPDEALDADDLVIV